MRQLRDFLVMRMRETFGEDHRRIAHALAVLQRAEQIYVTESQTDSIDAEVVVAAAILHDIGIHAAEKKHGSAGGNFQELEGPPIARKILAETDLSEDAVEHICRIIANHHSARDIDTPEFRILWDADWLVNIPEECDLSDTPRVRKLVETIFKTASGKAIAQGLYLR